MGLVNSAGFPGKWTGRAIVWITPRLILISVDTLSLRRLSRCTLATMGVILACGCAHIERSVTINTEPSGALVYLNGEEIGRSPVKHDFTWYGKYEVQVRKEGYEALKTHQWVTAPWWQWMPLDLAAELIPARLVDHRDYAYRLSPEPAANPQQMIRWAHELRGQLESGVYTPAPATKPTTQPAGE